MRLFVEIFGWYGAIGLISAYALVSYSILSPTSIWYQLLNLTAALGIVTVSFHKKTYQPGILNVIWSFVALIALLKIIF